MQRLLSFVALILLFGITGKAFAQYEFEYVFDSIKNETPCVYFYDIVELENGDFIINGRDKAFDKGYNMYRFSPDGELITEKPFYDELKLPGYSNFDHEGWPLLVDPDGGFYLFMTYNPYFDTTNVNYVAGTFDSKIMMRKLNDDFEVEYSKEMSVSIDTADWENLWGQDIAGCDPPKIHLGTIMDDKGEGFIISYEKYIGEHPGHLWDHGRDTTFFLRTDYDLNIKTESRYPHEKYNDKRHRNHVLYDSEQDKFLYYISYSWGSGSDKGFNVLQFDSDFSFLEENVMPGTTGSGDYVALNYRDENEEPAGITFKRTSAPTTIFGANADYTDVLHNVNLLFTSCVEVRDNARRVDSIRFAYTYPDPNGGSYIYGFRTTAIPTGRCMDWVDENRIFIGGQPEAYVFYALNLTEKYNKNFILRRIDRNFNTLDELYYNLGEDSTSLYIKALRATRDGGCIIAGYFWNYYENPYENNSRAYHSVVKKFPPEAFDGIDEAHDNGLKLALAYPNPGNNELHIRTALQNAHVIVYDINGKLICNQEITDIITTIDTEHWPQGTYIWKVVSDDKEAEVGKWVKVHRF